VQKEWRDKSRETENSWKNSLTEQRAQSAKWDKGNEGIARGNHLRVVRTWKIGGEDTRSRDVSPCVHVKVLFLPAFAPLHRHLDMHSVMQ
jgi:hypothetical protein